MRKYRPPREANREHFARILAGVETWNAWRQENPYIVAPDLEDANLQGWTHAERTSRKRTGARIRCWFASESLKIGDRFRREIDRSILVHDRLLVILSAASLDSSWVEDEVEAALERERKTKADVLFPVRIDDEVVRTDTAWAATLRRTRHIGDFCAWSQPSNYKPALARLLRDLRTGSSRGE